MKGVLQEIDNPPLPLTAYQSITLESRSTERAIVASTDVTAPQPVRIQVPPVVFSLPTLFLLVWQAISDAALPGL